VRAPLLQGQWPTVTNLAVCGLTIAVLWGLAALVIWRSENKVIRYL
jgi:ABC-type polysaccharide/polyol phosphate export permease